jgi:two-component system OmpR family response regulator
VDRVQVPKVNPNGGSMRILVVEDHSRMAALVGRGLDEAGYAVDTTGSGVDALWRATEFDYDAIVLDLRLPDADGFSVCAQLRERGRWAPILMLTARDAVADRVRGLDIGADDYLTKPFALAELLARVRALLRRGPHPRPVALDVGELSLDPATRLVQVGDQRVNLTAKEFALLEFFMRRPGQVLSRTEILQHVWDFAYDGDSNVIDVYVRYLRQKIDRPYGSNRLQTVRGSGYRLDPGGGS